ISDHQSSHCGSPPSQPQNLLSYESRRPPSPQPSSRVSPSSVRYKSGRGDPVEDFDLPPPDTKAWGRRKKAAVVLGLRKGLITREQAYEMYRLSVEELASWEDAFDRGGYRALALKARGAAR